MGKSTISMAISNSYVSLPEGKHLVGFQPLWKMMEWKSVGMIIPNWMEQ